MSDLSSDLCSSDLVAARTNIARILDKSQITRSSSLTSDVPSRFVSALLLPESCCCSRTMTLAVVVVPVLLLLLFVLLLSALRCTNFLLSMSTRPHFAKSLTYGLGPMDCACCPPFLLSPSFLGLSVCV